MHDFKFCVYNKYDAHLLAKTWFSGINIIMPNAIELLTKDDRN